MQSLESYRLMLVEDDRELASMVAEFLTAQQFIVSVEHDGLKAVQRLSVEPFDVAVLDIGLPGIDGIEVCRRIRNQFSGPIVMLTARGDEVDEVIALEVGADDYMSKPVRPRALLARLRLHLRRVEAPTESSSASRIEVSGMKIDSAGRTVQVEGKDVVLTTAEFDLLWLLAENAGHVVDRRRIYRDLIGMPYDGLDRSVDLRISRLRKKIGDDPNLPKRIKSIRGVGYLLAVLQ
ncbi:MAG: response regulator transcription factor [Pirellulaceae bacterium]